eukprot:5793486-Pleurochrysis_carterae.AAC.5
MTGNSITCDGSGISSDEHRDELSARAAKTLEQPSCVLMHLVSAVALSPIPQSHLLEILAVLLRLPVLSALRLQIVLQNANEQTSIARRDRSSGRSIKGLASLKGGRVRWRNTCAKMGESGLS